MRAQEITFLNLVQGEKQFQVPLYQRTYSWGRDQLLRLWEDVGELVEQHRAGEAAAPHFLGSVVLAPGQIQAGVQKWLVVDGQQRLTTLMLAFTALRDQLKESGDPRGADRVHRQILVNEYQDGLGHYRLLPTQADREAYTACVASTPRVRRRRQHRRRVPVLPRSTHRGAGGCRLGGLAGNRGERSQGSAVDRGDHRRAG